MNTHLSHPPLPVEIVLRVIDCLAPDTDVALHFRDPATRTIKAFTLVSRATYTTALRLLYTHCLYIDSSSRLRRLLVCLCDHHLSPARALTNTLPPVSIKPCMRNLYLAPFPKKSLDDLPTASWIFELFTITRHTLRRLIINIPFRSLPQWQDHLSVRPKLRAAFSELTALEEFTSINDDLYLSTHESFSQLPVQPPIWSRWTHLRRLSLHGANLTHHDYAHLSTMTNLETLVIVRPDTDNRLAWNTLFNRLPLPHYQPDSGNDTPTPHRNLHIIWPEVDCGDAMNPHLTTTRLLHNATYHTNRCRWAQAWNTTPLPTQSEYLSRPPAANDILSDQIPIPDAADLAEGGRCRRGLRFSAVTIDCEYVPGTGWDHSESVKTWVRDRAVQGRLWRVDGSRFHGGVYHPDHWHQVCEGERVRPWLED